MIKNTRLIITKKKSFNNTCEALFSYCNKKSIKIKLRFTFHISSFEYQNRTENWKNCWTWNIAGDVIAPFFCRII